MLALPDGLGQMANRVVDRVVILVKATLPVSWSSCRIVAEGVEPQALPLLNAAGPKENCGAAPRPSDRCSSFVGAECWRACPGQSVARPPAFWG